MKPNQCGECKYKKIVHAQGNFEFYGCHCKPNKGKWIAEIEKCPNLERKKRIDVCNCCGYEQCRCCD